MKLIHYVQIFSNYANYFLLTPILFILCNFARIHSNQWQLHKYSKGYENRPTIYDIKYVIVFTGFLSILRILWNQFINQLFINIRETEQMNVKFYKISTGSFKVLYFIFISMWGGYLLYISNYIPKGLGGSLEINEYINNIKKGLPYDNSETFNFKMYYLFNLSYHVSSFIFHFFQQNRKNWQEMTMHHTATVLLITFSYLLGFLKVGHLVMLIHDITDIFVYLTKTINELKVDRYILIGCYIFGLIILFGYLRIYVFLNDVIIPSFTISFKEQYYHNSIKYFLTLLIILVFLHVYWFFLINQMILDFIINDKKKDKHEEYNN